MNDVLQGQRGTARATGLGAPYTMAGKSGTAQVFSVAQEDTYDEVEIDVFNLGIGEPKNKTPIELEEAIEELIKKYKHSKGR